MNLTMQQIHTDSDIASLAALADEIWHEFFPGIITVGQVDYMVEKFQSAPAMRQQIVDEYRYYFVRDANGIVGYIGIHPEEERLFLSKLYLKKQYRGRGYGREMLAFVVQQARALGKSAVYLTVNRGNAHSIAVYRAAGFKPIRTQVADIGNGYVMDDYVMQLPV